MYQSIRVMFLPNSIGSFIYEQERNLSMYHHQMHTFIQHSYEIVYARAQEII